jgi:predicted Zn-dependent protease
MRLADFEARYGSRRAAVARLEDLLRDAPEDLVRLNALGFTLADAGIRLDEAEVWLRRAYRMAAEDGFVIDSLGWLLFRQGKAAAGLRLLERADRASPGDPEILRHLGDVRRALGRVDEARRAYQAALAAHPSAGLRRLLEQRLGETRRAS